MKMFSGGVLERVYECNISRFGQDEANEFLREAVLRSTIQFCAGFPSTNLWLHPVRNDRIGSVTQPSS